METINHTKIKQWIEKTIDVLEAPEENNLSPEKLELFKKQTRRLQRTEGLTKTEEAGIEQINELINEAEPFYRTKNEEKKPHTREKTSLKSGIAQVCLAFAVFFGVILFIVVIISISSGSKTDTPQTNPDGTSKALVYTKISDFGDYSDSAQKNLQNGVSMCDVQNSLAKIDKYVSYVPNCNTTASTPSTSTKSTPSIDCTSTNFGIISSTHCQ